MAHVSLKQVTKVYDGGVAAVADVSFEVHDREFVVLVGPSGCGKSTTLRLIAGLEEVTSGEIAIDGHVINDVPPKDRDIAMVFQSYALYPHMTVRENLAFGLKMKRAPKDQIRERVREAAGILGLEDLLDRRPKALSGGQRQRVALGRALVRKPKVFLFDEPLSNLDAKLRVQMRAELVRLHGELETTVIYVTHDQVEAMTMGSRIVVMDAGRVQQIAPPLELYRNPRNRFVAGFIGSPAMNFIRGTLRPAEEGWEFLEAEERWNLILPPGVLQQKAGEGELHVVLGVRPEELRLDAGNGGEGWQPHITATVEVVEPLGHDTFVTCRSGPYHLVVRTRPAVEVAMGAVVGLGVDTSRVRIFDAASGDRL